MQFYTFDASRQTAHVGLANIQFHAELIDKRAPCTAIARLCMYTKMLWSVAVYTFYKAILPISAE